MFSKIAIIACVLAVANAGAIGYSAPAAYAAPAIGYAAPAVASYAAPAYATSYAAPAYTSNYAASSLAATSENVYRSAGNLNTIASHSKTVATPFSSSSKHFTSVTNPGVYTQTAIAAPVATYAAAAPIAHASYAAPVAHASYAAPVAHASYAAPVAHASYAAPIAHAAPVAAHGSSLLGVAYSPAVAVSHMTYSSPVGINYSW
ncbi:pupal cuticle protein C1B [Nasonia vitripennis]|uniref:Uncharacterized protein n=1 Tax=Nasonia vitripennis TaxID=7425 RepID=A0A7M7G4G9_NASVI|nr:pupal cuticle protein C1B [Nasonia vitripennis]